MGEVVQHGRSELQANTRMVPAILAAGGSQHGRARGTNVELVWTHRNGTATRELLLIDYSQGVSGVRNSPLRNGDSVVGNNSTHRVTAYALGAITTPLSGLVNAWADGRKHQG